MTDSGRPASERPLIEGGAHLPLSMMVGRGRRPRGHGPINEVDHAALNQRASQHFGAVMSGRPSAVSALLYAKLIALCLARLLELSVEDRTGRKATSQLALVVAVTRCAPLLMSMMMTARGVTLSQLEERILIIAGTAARSRNQRRERAKRKRQKLLGS